MSKSNDLPAGENARPRLLSIPQAAHELGVCRTIIYGLLKEQKLTSIKIGRRRLIAHEAIDAFVAGLSKGSN
jgi:excisionase family DNA binding protein